MRASVLALREGRGSVSRKGVQDIQTMEQEEAQPFLGGVGSLSQKGKKGSARDQGESRPNTHRIRERPRGIHGCTMYNFRTPRIYLLLKETSDLPSSRQRLGQRVLRI